MNIPVICYGLRTNFKTKAFTGSLRLFELADELEAKIAEAMKGNVPMSAD